VTNSTQGRRLKPDIPARSANFNMLAIQLTLDPAVRSVKFIKSLTFPRCSVVLNMLVAERADGRVAFDIVDERAYRDLDSEGLLLIALERHDIRLVELDSPKINAEPQASNCRRIWQHHKLRVDPAVAATIERALVEHQELPIRAFSVLAGLRDPMPTVCALICRGVVKTDLSVKFGVNSRVSRRSGPGAPRRPPSPPESRAFHKGMR
jgi:hypothetical protein